MTAAESPADAAPVSPPGKSREPRVWKFIGTSLWGVALFGAMFAGQVAVVAYFLVTSGEPMDTSAMTALLTNGRIISLSVIMGLPAILAMLWLATRLSRTPFADYLALRWPSWRMLATGVASMVLLMVAWEVISRVAGRESSPGFFLAQVFSIGLLLGYLRYRSNSTWLTVILHGLNNLAATIQTIWLANNS